MIIMYDYSFYVIVYDISKYEGSLNWVMIVGQSVELIEGQGRGSVQVGKQIFDVALPPYYFCYLLQSLLINLFLLAWKEVEKFLRVS